MIASSFLLFSSLYAFDIDDSLKQISLKERIYLNHFFLRNLHSNQFGYVLFYPEKAAALTFINLKKSSYFPSSLASKGWQVWKQYESLFPHPNFIFCEEKQRSPRGFSLFLINKRNLRRVLEENAQMFHEALDEMFTSLFGEPFSPDLFMTKLEKIKRLTPLILGDQALLGVILGYGAESAKACKRRLHSEHKEGPWERIPLIAKRMQLHRNRKVSYVKSFSILPVAWMGNPESEEVQKLAEIYRYQCLQLRRRFNQKNCLRPVLQELCSIPEE